MVSELIANQIVPPSGMRFDSALSASTTDTKIEDNYNMYLNLGSLVLPGTQSKYPVATKHFSQPVPVAEHRKLAPAGVPALL